MNLKLSELNNVELISLHKAIHDRIKKLGHDLSWYERMSERDSSYVPKLALAESEYDSLLSVKKKINNELALREYASKENIS